MERNGITFDKLRQTLDAMTGRRVHVVGDTIVDSYTHCAMIGGQTKTPTMSVLFERKVDYRRRRWRSWQSTLRRPAAG